MHDEYCRPRESIHLVGAPCLRASVVNHSAPAELTNVALASTGTKATASGTYPNSDIHKLEHINDGIYGNSKSWISNEPRKGWVQLEFPQPCEISEIRWSRDRATPPQYGDRVATNYVIETSIDGRNGLASPPVETVCRSEWQCREAA